MNSLDFARRVTRLELENAELRAALKSARILLRTLGTPDDAIVNCALSEIDKALKEAA